MIINKHEFRLFLQEEEILKKVKEIAGIINKDYQGKYPLFLIVLKGAMIFASDIIRYLNIECDIEILQAASYHNNTKSSGKLEVKEFSLDVSGRNIVIIEDIVDSGLTITTITKHLESLNAKSIETVTLLLKPDAIKHQINIKYHGFEIPNYFVVGYGMDYAEKGRNLRDIYILTD